MSLKAKIEAVIYASEEPVTLAQLVGLLGEEAQAELDGLDARQGTLSLTEDAMNGTDEGEPGDEDALNAEALSGSFDAPPDAGRIAEATVVAASQAEDEPNALTNDANDAATEPEAPAAEGTAPDPATPSTAPEPTPPSERQLAADTKARERRLREYFREQLDHLIADYASDRRGLEIREVAGGFRLATKPEYHDAVRGFIKSLKPPLKLSLQALETLAVVAYKQPVTAPEVSEIRGVDSGGVLGSLLSRKLVTTAGRKAVIGRPILYKTTKEFLLRFGLKDTAELPSIEEFEKMAGEFAEAVQEEIAMADEQTDAQSIGAADAQAVEPLRDVHAAQADGVPQDPGDPADVSGIHPAGEIDAEHLTDPGDDPGEFTGNTPGGPAASALIDGRETGLPPTYDAPTDESADSPALDAEVQSDAGDGD